jgi:hypothetical protein
MPVLPMTSERASGYSLLKTRPPRVFYPSALYLYGGEPVPLLDNEIRLVVALTPPIDIKSLFLAPGEQICPYRAFLLPPAVTYRPVKQGEHIGSPLVFLSRKTKND